MRQSKHMKPGKLQKWTLLAPKASATNSEIPGDDATGLEGYRRWYDEVVGTRDVSVRQIPPNRRSVTGLVPSRKNGTMVEFESALERDFVTLLEFDHTVVSYREQPLKLPYRASSGRPVVGVPDFLLTRRVGGRESTILCDVKYRREIFERWRELKPRLKAARSLAIERGWTYRIYTEVEIRTPFLHNARFLLPYQRCCANGRHSELLLEKLQELGETTPAQLIAAVYPHDRDEQAVLIPTLWNLVSHLYIGVDLAKPLTMTSPIWGI